MPAAEEKGLFGFSTAWELDLQSVVLFSCAVNGLKASRNNRYMHFKLESG